MAKATFTNEQLCRAWAKQVNATPKGTRGDVVKDLMTQMGQNSTNADDYRKVYNNVTQRKKQLASHPTKPIKFPELTVGKKGARRTDDQMDTLQAIFNTE